MFELADLFPDPSLFPQTAPGFIQLVIVAAAYGYVLFLGAGLISDGSELLLLVPSLSGVVGSVVLPILGAVPDGMIVLFSGLGDDAQQQLSVGAGALAGSTIMLLTIPWFLSVYSGRVDLDENNKSNYTPRAGRPKCSPSAAHPWHRTGIEVLPAIRTNSVIMGVTALTYFVIQGPGFKFDKDDEDSPTLEDDVKKDKWYAFAGLLMCAAMFVAYICYQFYHQESEQTRERIERARTKAIQESMLSLTNAFTKEYLRATITEHEELLGQKDLQRCLKHFFRRHDADGDGNLDRGEIRDLLRELNVNSGAEELQEFMTKVDTDRDNKISFGEFEIAMEALIFHHQNNLRANGDSVSGMASKPPMLRIRTAHRGFPENNDDGVDEEFEKTHRGSVSLKHRTNGDGHEIEAANGVNAKEKDDALKEHPVTALLQGDEEEEEEVEMPEDFASLTPAEQQRRIKRRSAYLMGLGVLIVIFLSDPAVDVLDEIGKRTHIPAFYVSFVLAPLASNAAELVAAYNYAKKKTRKTITISLSTLLGAAIMNNTFTLLIFLGLVFGRGLAWVYTAETLAIVAVEYIMCIVALARVQTLPRAILVLCLFPLSIGFVALLENVAGLN